MFSNCIWSTFDLVTLFFRNRIIGNFFFRFMDWKLEYSYLRTSSWPTVYALWGYGMVLQSHVLELKRFTMGWKLKSSLWMSIIFISNGLLLSVTAVSIIIRHRYKSMSIPIFITKWDEQWNSGQKRPNLQLIL